MNAHRLARSARETTVAAGLVLGLAMSAVLVAAAPVSAVSGTKPVVVVLCNFSNNTQQPLPASYYREMFGQEGSGKLGAFDYWRDVSYGNLSVAGTVVSGWHTLGITRDTWAGYDRIPKWTACAEAAKPHVDYSKYAGAIVVFPDAVTTTSAAIDASATTVTLTSLTAGSAANFPTPPFQTFISNTDASGNQVNVEAVKVTAVSGTTFTIERGQAGTTAVAHPAGSTVQVGGDLFGFNPSPVSLGGTTYTLGGVLGSHDLPLSVLTHEQGHLFGLNHSRTLSQWPANEYFDCFDVMSVFTCAYSFQSGAPGTGTAFGGSAAGGTGKGPGLNSIQLDTAGWLAGDRKATFDNSSCTQSTYAMAALNHPEKSGLFQVRIPAAVPIPKMGGGTINSEYYTLELRSETGWDRGIPEDSFVLHLKGSDGYSYLVDRDSAGLPVGFGGQGDLRVGGRYIDTARNTYIAVNRINAADFTGLVTVGGCRINAALSYVGDVTAVYRKEASLAADLLVTGSNAPVPGVNVAFTLGSQSCTGRTNTDGRASCTITIDQPSGSYSVDAAFAGNSTYNPANLSTPFTVERAATALTYTGPAVILQGGSGVTLSAVLLEDGIRAPSPAGQTVTLGVGGESCTGTTTATGLVSCTLTITGPLGDQPLSAVFAGDAYYLPSADLGRTAVVFAFPSRGAFALGNNTVAAAGASSTLTWWSDTWSKQNSLSGGGAPSAFKGFADVVTLPADTPPATCAGNWSTTGGNSPPPTADVPSYMGVIVAPSAAKAPGNTVAGTYAGIVVVKTNPGYAPNPGSPGTGTVVAVYC